MLPWPHHPETKCLLVHLWWKPKEQFAIQGPALCQELLMSWCSCINKTVSWNISCANSCAKAEPSSGETQWHKNQSCKWSRIWAKSLCPLARLKRQTWTEPGAKGNHQPGPWCAPAFGPDRHTECFRENKLALKSKLWSGAFRVIESATLLPGFCWKPPDSNNCT